MTSSMWDDLHPAVLPRTVARPSREARVYTVSPLTVTDGGLAVPAVNGLPNWVHASGDSVVVSRSGSGLAAPLVITATRAVRPTVGTVLSSGGGLVTVSASGVTYSLPYLSNYTPVASDVVRILWDGAGGTVLGKAPAAAAPPASGVVTVPSGVVGTLQLELDPIGAASYRSGAQRTDRPGEVIQGHYLYSSNTADNSGLWVYGDSFGSTAGKPCRSFAVKVKRLDGVGINSGVPVHLRLHTHATLPSGAPSFTADAEYAGMSLPVNGVDTVTLPPALAAVWGGKFASGAAFGVGVVYAGTGHYASFAGPDISGNAGSGHLSMTFDA